MATIRDVAKKAGVSVTTVSRALNGYSDVNEKTRERIKQIAQELSYSPNLLARSLVMKKTKTIGLLVSGLRIEGSKDNFTFEVLCGVNDCAGELGYELVLISTDSKKQQEKTYKQLCKERKVEGVILQGIKTDDPYLDEVLNSEIACILIDVPMESDSVGYVTTDNIAGAKTAVEHLTKLGHRNIGMVNGHSQAFVSQERLEGYKKALGKNGIRFNENYVVDGAFLEETAEQVTTNLLQKHPEITALFCASDLMAMGAIRAAKQLGKNLPDNLSIVGFDNIILSSYCTPSLSTVAQNRYQLGVEATVLLTNILEGKTAEKSKVLPTEFIKRESTTENHG
ncbi:LacI family transcriptional regulator [Fictibacillus phosphorivorans]|uniref:LacI family transcriptional regulator n=1 Tax=Fictibacillus phosphorivorans TaxID=1221500 RepID=A0A163SKR3_9BACL|nr:LacI family DNA-binding transcriptional regulator [Fictibacillus phosphorivorans]KZE69319.1 LacI family transcriptional regulator [Fictibacillus phosphorivorans]